MDQAKDAKASRNLNNLMQFSSSQTLTITNTESDKNQMTPETIKEKSLAASPFQRHSRWQTLQSKQDSPEDVKTNIKTIFAKDQTDEIRVESAKRFSYVLQNEERSYSSLKSLKSIDQQSQIANSNNAKKALNMSKIMSHGTISPK